MSVSFNRIPGARRAPTAKVFKAIKAMAGKPEGKKLNKRQVAQVKRLVNRDVEMKYYDVQVGAQPISSTPYIAGLSTVAVGDSDTTRTGDSIVYARLNGRILLNAYAAVANYNEQRPMIRIIVFQWHPTSQAAGVTQPGAASILQTGPVAGAPDTLSHYSWDQRPNYTILKDFLVRLANQGQTQGLAYNSIMSWQGNFDVSLAKARKHPQYVAGATDTAANHLYLMVFSNDPAAAYSPVMWMQFRLQFRDP